MAKKIEISGNGLLVTDTVSSLVVNGWYCKIIRKG